jgi:hypothetical protein
VDAVREEVVVTRTSRGVTRRKGEEKGVEDNNVVDDDTPFAKRCKPGEAEKRGLNGLAEQREMESLLRENQDWGGMIALYESVEELVRKKGFKTLDKRGGSWRNQRKGTLEKIKKCIVVCHKGYRDAFVTSVSKIGGTSYKCACKKL